MRIASCTSTTRLSNTFTNTFEISPTVSLRDSIASTVEAPHRSSSCVGSGNGWSNPTVAVATDVRLILAVVDVDVVLQQIPLNGSVERYQERTRPLNNHIVPGMPVDVGVHVDDDDVVHLAVDVDFYHHQTTERQTILLKIKSVSFFS